MLWQSRTATSPASYSFASKTTAGTCRVPVPAGTCCSSTKGRGTRRSVEVRTEDGVPLAGPTTVKFDERYPNGKGCDPRVLSGQVVVSPAGEISRATDLTP